MTASNSSTSHIDVRGASGSSRLLAYSQSRHRPTGVIALAALLKDVIDARTTLARARHTTGAPPGSTEVARAQVITALEAYTAALEGQRLPVPYMLRDELRIQQRVSR